MPFKPDPQQQEAAAPRQSRFRPDPTPAPAAAPAPKPLDVQREPGYVDRYVAASGDVERSLGTPTQSLYRGPVGLGETALQLGTSVIAPFAGAIDAGLARLGWEDPQNPEKSIATATRKYVYEPRTDAGRAMSGQVGAMLAPVGDALQFGSDVTADVIEPFDETVAQDVRDAGPDLFGSVLGLKGGKKAAAPRTAPTPKEVAAGDQAAPTRKARSMGTKLSPSEEAAVSGNKNYVGRSLEAIAGSDNVRRDMSQANKKTFTKKAEQAIGAKSLKKDDIGKVKDAGDAVYTEMGGLGTIKPDSALSTAFDDAGKLAGKSTRRNAKIDREIERVRNEYREDVDANQVVNRVRELRREASKNITGKVGEKPDPQNVALGEAQQRLADALDDLLERSATAAGKPELAQSYKAARRSLAKTANVENATRAGQVSAQDLYNQREKGAPLSGELSDMADVNEFFPESTNDRRLADFHPPGTPSILEIPVRFAQSMVRPLISRFLQSDLYQNTLGREGAVDLADNADAFDNWPGTVPADPNIGPPRGQNAPSVDFSGELGLAPDPGPRASLPGGNALARGARSDLRLQEDVAPTGAGPNSLRNSPDEINFEELSPEQVGPYRVNTDLNVVRDPHVRMNPLGRSIDLARELQLAPDDVPGARQELPPSPGAPAQRADATVRAQPTGPQPRRSVQERLEEDALNEWAMTLQNDINQGFGVVDDMSLADDAIVPGTEMELSAMLDELNQLAAREQASPRGVRTQNNASGESAASVEAINRVQAEKAAGQKRYVIDRDGTVTPLVGVDAVDAVARPGQVIVQRGVGAEPYTILDRGGLGAGAARNRLNAALSSLEGG